MIDYSKKRFLVVDDFSDFRSSVTGMLRQMAVQNVDTAANGDEALAQCRRNAYDIILHDYNLGAGKNGQQVLEELHHAKLISPHCIFVMVTAESSQAMVMAALECEPDAYLTKPFNRASLQQRLDKLVERKNALKPILDALEKNDQQTVVTASEKAMAALPRFAPQCQRYLATALESLGKHAELEKLLEGLVNDRPMPWALVALADHWQRIGQLDKAEALYNKAIGLFPMVPALYDGLAAIAAAQGDTAKAQEYLQQGIRISPNSLSRQAELGKLAQANDNHEQAIRAFRQAVELGRNSVFRDPENHLALATSLTDQAGDSSLNSRALVEIRQTLGELNKTWKNDPVLAVRSDLTQARTLAKTGQTDEANRLAQAAAEKITTLDKFFSAETALVVAAQLRNLGQDKQADEVLSTCAEMYGDDPKVMAGVASQTQDPAILSAGAQAQTWNREGIRCYQKKQFPEALELFRKAWNSQPRNVSFALNTAQSLLRLLAAQPDASLKEECLQCLQQVRSMPESDHRYERYQKLCATVEKL